MRTHHENTAHEIHGEFRWRTFEPTDSSVTDGTAEEAAEALGIDVTELKWAIEEYGRCDAEHAVAWKPGEPENDYAGEPWQGGWEWPVAEAPAAE